MSTEREPSSIKGMLFTPSSIICAIFYYLLVVGAVTTYDVFQPLLESSKVVTKR